MILALAASGAVVSANPRALASASELPICGPAARLSFRDSSPVDVFTIENITARANRDWVIAGVEIDLGPSAGRLVFDTVPGGAGQNVAQPFKARPPPGGARLADLPVVPDGAEGLALLFSAFAPGQNFRFTIDMDDRLGGLGTRVDGPEIEGAMVTVRFADPADGREAVLSAPFDSLSRAMPAEACLS